MMLISLAWRNVWRSRKRSAIMVTSITFGLWGGLLAGAVMVGWGQSMVSSAIDRDLGHIQVHKPGFEADHDIHAYIPEAEEVISGIRHVPGVEGASSRTIVMAMAASPTSSFGVQIDGVDPTRERGVTTIAALIREGDYLVPDSRNRIVIGRKLAQRLDLRLHSKLVLSFQAFDSSMTSAAFTVEGIFKSGSTTFDETHVFVNRSDLTRLLGGRPVTHEIAVRIAASGELPQVMSKMHGTFPFLSVTSWRQSAPEIAATVSATALWSYLFVGIILLALTFGITNTMLMAVMERRHELGILIGVGMTRGKVWVMILLETIMLSLTGGAAGLIFGAGTIQLLSRSGIDFSRFSAGLESFGAGAILYPVLPLSMYMALALMLFMAATIGATFPAWKAVHLKPAEAIRE